MARWERLFFLMRSPADAGQLGRAMILVRRRAVRATNTLPFVLVSEPLAEPS